MNALIRKGDEILIKVTVRENLGDVLMVQLDEPRGLTRFPVDIKAVRDGQGAPLARLSFEGS